MKRIFKQIIETADFQTIELPEGSEILTIQTQYSDVCLWYLFEDSVDNRESKIIEIFGTGHEFIDADRKYIGTYQLNGGSLVFHAFERI